MITGRLNEYQCKTDFLRLMTNRWLIYSLNCFIVGKGQVGKSTGVWYMANRMKQLRNRVTRTKATWKEWDWENYTTTDPRKFAKLWDECNDEILSLEEVSQTMYYLDWTNTMSRVFSNATNVLGMKHNFCFLITPYFGDLVKNARDKIDYVGLFHHKDLTRMRVSVIPKYVRLNWNTFKPELKRINPMRIDYTKKILRESEKYTEWLKEYKAKVSKRNISLADGYDPDKPMSMKNMPSYVRKTMNSM